MRFCLGLSLGQLVQEVGLGTLHCFLVVVESVFQTLKLLLAVLLTFTPVFALSRLFQAGLEHIHHEGVLPSEQLGERLFLVVRDVGAQDHLRKLLDEGIQEALPL